MNKTTEYRGHEIKIVHGWWVVFIDRTTRYAENYESVSQAKTAINLALDGSY